MIEKICPECGAAFVPTHGNKVCCSDECKHERANRQRRKFKRRNYHFYRARKLSPRKQLQVNLARRDLLAPKPRTEIIYHGGVIIERRGFIPAGVGALRRVCC